MRIICTAVENYKLTEGKIYNAESESRDFYKLLNDNNIGVRYNKRLFRLAEEGEVAQTARPAVPAIPVPPPPPPALTETDLVNSILIASGEVIFTNFDRQVVVVRNRFASSGSVISCGVSQISGINQQIQEIDSKFNLDQDDYIAIRKALLAKCITQYVQAGYLGHNAFGMMSTNVSGTDEGHIADEDMLSVLDTLASNTSARTRNPNSGRDIKVWIMSSAA